MAFNLPLSLLLIPYGLFVLVFFFYAFFNLFQLYTHGIKGLQTQVLVIAFMVIVAFILSLTYEYGSAIDWASALSLGMTGN